MSKVDGPIVPMGFFDWFRPTIRDEVASPWSDPSHLENITLSELWPGLDHDQLPVGRWQAMQVPALARCRNLLCTSVGRMQLTAQTSSGTATHPDIVRQPDPGHPAFVTWSWTIDELFWHGVAWHYVLEEDIDGRAVRTRVLPQTRIDYDDTGNPIGFAGERLPHRWIRIDGASDGVLNTGRQSIRSALAIEKAYRRSASMPIPAIDLHQTTPNPQLSKEKRAELVASWVAARNSVNGAVGYTSHNIQARPLGAPAENLLIAARNAAALDMARLAGMPAWAVDATTGGSSLTYSNLVDRNRELVDYSFAAYMAPIEARWSLDDILPAGTWARFSTLDWLRGDLKYRAEAYTAAKAAGLMTDQQIQDAERGLPLEG